MQNEDFQCFFHLNSTESRKKKGNFCTFLILKDEFSLKTLQKPCTKIMASLKLYFDKRAQRKDNKKPLKAGITNKNDYTLINLDVLLLPDQWDASANRVVNHPNKLFLNNYISKRVLDIETVLLKLTQEGVIQSMNIKDIKNCIMDSLNPVPDKEKEETSQKVLFADQLRLFISNKDNTRTKELYQCTLNRINDFTNIENLTFEDMNLSWLKSFERFLSAKAPSVNARNVHLRNIRAVFNAAIDEELISCYPFRKFKIKGKETPKRSLQVEQLRTLRDFECEKHQESYRDIFILSFYLIGINIIDLCHLTHKSIVNGRIEYYRAKTGKLYSIKIEPEIEELIKRYKGKQALLDILDRYKNYKDYAQRLNDNIREIGSIELVETNIKGKKRNIKKRTPLFPDITTYWARHTWATIAHKIGVPKDTISMALGHEFGQKVTGIYIDLDMEKVDEANRMVIDYIHQCKPKQ
ncbi:MAG: site-specific integrase [Lachnospiraceae bacterium]